MRIVDGKITEIYHVEEQRLHTPTNRDRVE